MDEFLALVPIYKDTILLFNRNLTLLYSSSCQQQIDVLDMFKNSTNE